MPVLCARTVNAHILCCASCECLHGNAPPVTFYEVMHIFICTRHREIASWGQRGASKALCLRAVTNLYHELVEVPLERQVLAMFSSVSFQPSGKLRSWRCLPHVPPSPRVQRQENTEGIVVALEDRFLLASPPRRGDIRCDGASDRTERRGA